MPNKPSPISKPTLPLADQHAVTKPERGFQRVAARIAKPLKGLGFGGGGRPTLETSVNHVARASNLPGGPVAERPVSAEFLASMERSFARSAASSKVDRVFDPGVVGITKMKQEILNLKTLVQKIRVDISELDRQLDSISPVGGFKVIECKLKKMEYQYLERDTHLALNQYCKLLREAIDSECVELQTKIDFWNKKMPEADESGKQSLHQQIVAAEIEQHKLRFDRAEWQV